MNDSSNTPPCPFAAGDTVELWPGGPKTKILTVDKPYKESKNQCVEYNDGTDDDPDPSLIVWPSSLLFRGMRKVELTADMTDDIAAAGWHVVGFFHVYGKIIALGSRRVEASKNGVFVNAVGADDGAAANKLREVIGLPVRPVKGEK